VQKGIQVLRLAKPEVSLISAHEDGCLAIPDPSECHFLEVAGMSENQFVPLARPENQHLEVAEGQLAGGFGSVTENELFGFS
jgi:hypothetical protein